MNRICWYVFFALVLLLLVIDESLADSRQSAFVGYSEVAFPRRHRPPPPAQGREYLIFTTAYGVIKVRLFVNEAPLTIQHIKFLVKNGSMNGCTFYRAEPPGETIDTGYSGTRKGYALVQGGLHSCGRQSTTTLPVESEMANTKGTISLITGTSEFFFNLEDHLEWNGSFTVWGEVADESSWQVLKTLVALPTRQEKHPSGTVMRILLNEVTFSASLRRF